MPSLKRSLNLPLISFYGIGTIVGAGIFALIGKVAGQAGLGTPIAFLLAAIIAVFTSFSYAELSARYPLSAGEAVYVQKAFHQRSLSQLVGWAVVFLGIVSTAAMTRGLIGYFQFFFSVPPTLIIIFFVLLLTSVALWGITESVTIATVITLIEVFGLLLVIYAARHALFSVKHYQEIFANATFNLHGFIGVISGAFLAFYAFIGFEDMVNVAEEVKNPSKNLPYAIFIAIATSSLLYMLVSLAAILTVPIHELASSSRPLALLIAKTGQAPPSVIALISLIAILNGALIQIIMASRVLYGMAKQNNAPTIFASVWQKTKTPAVSTLFVGVIVLVFTLWLPLVPLAKITSFVILLVFALVNLALIAIKLTGIKTSARQYPFFLPVVGLILTLGLVIFQVS